MNSNELVKFINGQRYTLEYKSANMPAIMKEMDKEVKSGQIRIKKNNGTKEISGEKLVQAHTKRLLDEPMIKIFLNYKGYSEMISSDKVNWISFNNGKTSIEIFTRFGTCFPCSYQFNEYYENENIVSRGCFSVKSSGISYLQFYNYKDRNRYYYFQKPEYKGSEYFRQAFMCDNKLATISLIVKKVAEHPGWCCTYPEFSISIVVRYYDLDNNLSLKGITTDAMFEYMSLAGNFLSEKSIPNYIDTIPVVPSVCDSNNAHWDSSFFSSRIEEYQKPIQKGISKAYRKIEQYFGTKLEKQENLSFVKKLIPSKNKINK